MTRGSKATGALPKCPRGVAGAEQLSANPAGGAPIPPVRSGLWARCGVCFVPVSMRPLLLVTAVWVGLVGCASGASKAHVRGEPLYFAVEVVRDGQRVAAPKLLGISGHRVLAERKRPGATDADYRLLLEPQEQGSGYQLGLELSLPSGTRKGSVGLLHGEERTIRLDADVQVKVMLMRVDSDEFRSLMQPTKSDDSV